LTYKTGLGHFIARTGDIITTITKTIQVLFVSYISAAVDKLGRESDCLKEDLAN
jgi:hypothetical protein